MLERKLRTWRSYKRAALTGRPGHYPPWPAPPPGPRAADHKRVSQPVGPCALGTLPGRGHLMPTSKLGP